MSCSYNFSYKVFLSMHEDIRKHSLANLTSKNEYIVLPIDTFTISPLSSSTSQLLRYNTHRHFLLMLSFCRIVVCHIIGNKIRADATLRLGHEVLFKGHQGQMIFSSMFISKPNIES